MKKNELRCITLSPLALLAVATTLPSHVCAQAPEPPKEERRDDSRRGGDPGRPGGTGRVSPIVAALDTNKDGEISADELANAPTALRSLDKNSDGKLTVEELRPAPQSVVVPADDIVGRLMEFDRNGDGKLSLSELPSRMKSLVTQADTNKDGILTRNELTAFTEKQEVVRRQEAERREKLESERQKRESVPPQGEPGRPGGPGRVSPLVAALDTDKDGEVSARGLTNASTSLRTLDKDNNGTLTADEIRPAPPAGFGRGER